MRLGCGAKRSHLAGNCRLGANRISSWGTPAYRGRSSAFRHIFRLVPVLDAKRLHMSAPAAALVGLPSLEPCALREERAAFERSEISRRSFPPHNSCSASRERDPGSRCVTCQRRRARSANRRHRHCLFRCCPCPAKVQVLAKDRGWVRDPGWVKAQVQALVRSSHATWSAGSN